MPKEYTAKEAIKLGLVNMSYYRFRNAILLDMALKKKDQILKAKIIGTGRRTRYVISAANLEKFLEQI